MSTPSANQPEPIVPASDDAVSDGTGLDSAAIDSAAIDGSGDGSVGGRTASAHAPSTGAEVEALDGTAASAASSGDVPAPVSPEDDEAPVRLTSYPDEAHPVVLDRTTLRRAPRFGRFALVAVIGGLVLGAVLGYVIFPASHPGWSRVIFALEVAFVTLAVTLVAALISDARSRRRSTSPAAR